MFALAPIDFSRLANALDSRVYWIELALVLVCVGIAWVIDRRIEARALANTVIQRHPSLSAGVGRIVFSLAALALLFVVRPVFRAYAGDSFFIDIAIPLLVALAVIRMLLFAMRRLFADSSWLKTSERAIAFSIWGLAILYFVGVLPVIARELDAFVVPLGKTPISLLTIAQGAGAVLVTLVVTLWLSGLIEQRLAASEAMDTNTRALLAKVLRAVLLVAGVLVALRAIGFDLTLLTVFGGALGVGVGLGLQKFAANYIAGFTILLDKSIRLGDMITVDNRQGRVAKVTSRYVVLRSLDGIEAIVPNETLVTTTVLNHSHAAHDIRVATSVRVAYGTDVERAIAIMQDAARADPRVVAVPEPPTAFVNALGENGIDLELVLWVQGPQPGVQALRSEVNRGILTAFAAEGIAIPAPRRDITVSGTISAPSADMTPVNPETRPSRVK
jgi:small-conductance mechanosensitive channel